jgi:hypothetical protein
LVARREAEAVDVVDRQVRITAELRFGLVAVLGAQARDLPLVAARSRCAPAIA